MGDCNHSKKVLKPFGTNDFSHTACYSLQTFIIFMAYLFTSESVSEGHPDKVADQISDALIDNFLAWDEDARVAIETLVTTGQVVLAGEVKSKIYLDVQKITRQVIEKIGYTKSEYMFEANSCGVLSAIHEQSADINQGVDRITKQEQGAGEDAEPRPVPRGADVLRGHAPVGLHDRRGRHGRVEEHGRASSPPAVARYNEKGAG